jgi:hypothetical protein
MPDACYTVELRRDTLNPLTYEEHRELARELHRSRARLLQLYSVVAGVYGPQNRSTFAFTKLNEAVERALSDLSAQATLDCPGTDAAEFYRTPAPRSNNAG